jgi:hypothetical protein
VQDGKAQGTWLNKSDSEYLGARVSEFYDIGWGNSGLKMTPHLQNYAEHTQAGVLQ